MSLRFECQYCPDTFGQFKDLARHFEACHSKETNTLTHADSNNGCQLATDFLDRQSHCILLDGEHNIIDKCPFPKCVFDEPGVGFARAKKRDRDEEIRQRFGPSESIPDLAVAFGISRRTIQRAIRNPDKLLAHTKAGDI